MKHLQHFQLAYPSNAVDGKMNIPLLNLSNSSKEDVDQVWYPTERRPETTRDLSSPEQQSVTSRQSSFSNLLYEYIDNTTLVYIPIQISTGNTVYCAPDVLSQCPMIVRSIQADLTQVLQLLPWSVHALIKRTQIWINSSYSYGPRDDPHVLRHSTTHHHEGWLIECARDRPEKAHGIEIYSSSDYERMRLHWNGCGLILHEFCHLIHQTCLGLDSPQVERLYREALRSGKYDRTLRRDWAGKEEDSDMAYALLDVKEFFAEMSVTYWSCGYNDLDTADNSSLESCSPPLLEPISMGRVLAKYGIQTEPYLMGDSDQSKPSMWNSLLAKHRSLLSAPTPKLRMVNPNWQEAAVGRGCRDVPHCNKFYPFTRGQLHHHDPDLLLALHTLWNEISMFDDPLQDPTFCWVLRRVLPARTG
eukprot:Nitzschia sp. Nitz4//scaffold341_size29662//7475//8725//NITZ4_008037-RA/size29662-processed-gene-0.26-mRNA-1//-1//CDS//3329548543//1562//frame0